MSFGFVLSHIFCPIYAVCNSKMVLWKILWEQCYGHYHFCSISIEINRLRKTGFQYKLLAWLLNPQTLLKKWIQWFIMILWICTSICNAKVIKKHTPMCPVLCNSCRISHFHDDFVFEEHPLSSVCLYTILGSKYSHKDNRIVRYVYRFCTQP